MLNLKTCLKALLASTVFAGGGTVAYAYYHENVSTGLEIPDFKGVSEKEIDAWAKKYDVKDQVKIVYDYSETVDKAKVMDQSVKAGDILQDGDTLQLTLSLGPDQSKKFKLPDFNGQMRDQIEAWFEKTHFTSVTYTYEAVEDASLKTDAFISMEPGPGTEVLRTAEVKIKLVTNEIMVPDLVAMSKDEIQAWGDKWGIQITFEEEENKMMDTGSILAVSVAKDSKVKRGDTIMVKIAKKVESAEVKREEQMYQQTDNNADAQAGSTGASHQNNSGGASGSNQNSAGSTTGGSPQVAPQQPAPPKPNGCSKFFFPSNQSFGSSAEAKEKLSAAANQVGCPIVFYDSTDIRGDFQIENKGDHIVAYIKQY